MWIPTKQSRQNSQDGCPDVHVYHGNRMRLLGEGELALLVFPWAIQRSSLMIIVIFVLDRYILTGQTLNIDENYHTGTIKGYVKHELHCSFALLQYLRDQLLCRQLSLRAIP